MDNTKKSFSQLRTDEWADPEIREARVEGSRVAALRRYEDPAEHAKASERTIKAFKDPEKKRRHLEGVRAREARYAVEGRPPGSAGGMCKTPEYVIWRAMCQRCSNPNQKQWKDYGGRGIEVCDEWKGRGGFVRFFAEVGQRPTNGHSLGRIDNEENYAPGNVRWETRSQQASNTRRNVNVTIGGVTKHMAAWARQIGLSQAGFAARVARGYSDERLLEPPMRRGRRCRAE